MAQNKEKILKYIAHFIDVEDAMRDLVGGSNTPEEFLEHFDNCDEMEPIVRAAWKHGTEHKPESRVKLTWSGKYVSGYDDGNQHLVKHCTRIRAYVVNGVTPEEFDYLRECYPPHSGHIEFLEDGEHVFCEDGPDEIIRCFNHTLEFFHNHA